jgi:heme/copper-type cytochrome/quinol oxidase subunit 2
LEQATNREILEITLVIFSYFAPIIIMIILFYLGSNLIHQIAKYSTVQNIAITLKITGTIIGIIVFAYIEFKLIKWLR